jgi:hypothetical protein
MSQPTQEQNLQLYKGFGKEASTDQQKRVKHARKHYCFNTNKTYVLLDQGLIAKLRRFLLNTILPQKNTNSEKYLEVGQ